MRPYHSLAGSVRAASVSRASNLHPHSIHTPCRRCETSSGPGCNARRGATYTSVSMAMRRTRSCSAWNGSSTLRRAGWSNGSCVRCTHASAHAVRQPACLTTALARAAKTHPAQAPHEVERDVGPRPAAGQLLLSAQQVPHVAALGDDGRLRPQRLHCEDTRTSNAINRPRVSTLFQTCARTRVDTHGTRCMSRLRRRCARAHGSRHACTAGTRRR